MKCGRDRLRRGIPRKKNRRNRYDRKEVPKSTSDHYPRQYAAKHIDAGPNPRYDDANINEASMR